MLPTSATLSWSLFLIQLLNQLPLEQQHYVSLSLLALSSWIRWQHSKSLSDTLVSVKWLEFETFIAGPLSSMSILAYYSKHSTKFPHLVSSLCYCYVLSLVSNLQYASTSLIMNFYMLCIDFPRGLGDQRCFLVTCCYSHGNGGGGCAILLFSCPSAGLKNTPGPSGVVPTERGSHQRYGGWDVRLHAQT